MKIINRLLFLLYLLSSSAFVSPDLIARSNVCLNSFKQSSDKFEKQFCATYEAISKNSVPYSPKIFETQAPLIFLGETHKNNTIKKWLISELHLLKDKGYTHVAMEAINTSRQQIIDDFYNGHVTRESLIHIIDKDWGHIPSEHVDFIEAVQKMGLKVFGIDHRILKDQQRDQDLPILNRDEEMARALGEWVEAHPQSKVIVLMGNLHAQTYFNYPANFPRKSLSATEHLKERGIEVKSYFLESLDNERIQNPLRTSFVAAKTKTTSFAKLDRSKHRYDGALFIIP